MRLVSLAIILFLLWLGLSGHYTSLLISLGMASTIFSVLVVARMGISDSEGHPIRFMIGATTYWPWLMWEIVKSAWSVTWVILSPRLAISPTMTKVRATQKTTVGIATYGNSITLTPGTITTGVDGDVLTVHALVKNGAIDLEEGGMDARVTRFEGGA